MKAKIKEFSKDLIKIIRTDSFSLLIKYFLLIFLIISISTVFTASLFDSAKWYKAGIIFQILGVIFLSIWGAMGKSWGTQQIPNLISKLKPKPFADKLGNFWKRHREEIPRFLITVGLSLVISGLILQLLY